MWKEDILFKRYPQNINDITNQFMREYSLEVPLLERRLVASWKDVMPAAEPYTESIEIRNQTLPRNPNAQFLAFYEQFVTDSVFQRESLDEQIDYFKEVNGVSKISEVRNNILSLYRESANSLGWKESYEEKDYPNTISDRYLFEAKKIQQP